MTKSIEHHNAYNGSAAGVHVNRDKFMTAMALMRFSHRSGFVTRTGKISK